MEVALQALEFVVHLSKSDYLISVSICYNDFLITFHNLGSQHVDQVFHKTVPIFKTQVTLQLIQLQETVNTQYHQLAQVRNQFFLQ